MEKTEMEAMLKVALAEKDSLKRGWNFAQEIVKLGSVQELEMVQAIIRADDKLSNKISGGDFDGIEYEIELRRTWSAKLLLVSEVVVRYPHVAKRTNSDGYKVALLVFSEFCSCDVDYVCKVLEEVIAEFEAGAKKVERRCGSYAGGQWPRNHYASVLAAMAMFTQRPCWVIRYLFLPEVDSSSCGFKTVVFERKE